MSTEGRFVLALALMFLVIWGTNKLFPELVDCMEQHLAGPRRAPPQIELDGTRWILLATADTLNRGLGIARLYSDSGSLILRRTDGDMGVVIGHRHVGRSVSGSI